MSILFIIEVPMDKCTPESLLAEKKLKHTKQRDDVLHAIIEQDAPFCASGLHDELAENMDLATIYRNIEILCHEGIIREVINENDRQYYELACVHNPEHPHFYCSRCGRIYCMKQKMGKSFHPKANIDENFIVQHTRIQFRGLCPKCN
jgi:Fe2+ or Zn2+ uptake regulation protein